MKLACIAFTNAGLGIAHRIKQSQHYEMDIFDKENYKEQLGEIFTAYKAVLFICSTGIAVRLSAPYLKNKAADPAIVVIDDLGRFSISLASGHLGGANSLAQELSELLQCIPVITTASDGRAIEAVDLFAQKNQLKIESLEDAKKLTAMMVEDKKIKLDSELALALNYPYLSVDEYEGTIFVNSKSGITSDKPFCVLRPKNINVGVGCRRGKTKQEILDVIEEVFQAHQLSLNSLKAVATVDVKSDELGILEASKALGCELRIFTRDEIRMVEGDFKASAFVKESIGVTSVCEPCASLAGGKIIVPKTVKNGVTIAVAKEI